MKNRIYISCLFLFLPIILIIVSDLSAYRKSIEVIKINDPITPVIAEYIITAIDEAEEKSLECVVIEIDTPGGLDLAMRDIIKKICLLMCLLSFMSLQEEQGQLRPAPLLRFLRILRQWHREQISALLIPVNMGGEKMDETMSKKVENDAAAYAASIAEKRNRNKEWAVKAVRESVSVGETEALKLNIIDLISQDIESLIKDINGMKVDINGKKVKLVTEDTTIIYRKMGLRENILKALSNPNIAYILFLIGLAGLYFELSNPGAVFPRCCRALWLLFLLFTPCSHCQQIMPVFF